MCAPRRASRAAVNQRCSTARHHGTTHQMFPVCPPRPLTPTSGMVRTSKQLSTTRTSHQMSSRGTCRAPARTSGVIKVARKAIPVSGAHQMSIRHAWRMPAGTSGVLARPQTGLFQNPPHQMWFLGKERLSSRLLVCWVSDSPSATKSIVATA